jgi:hypothetical protein
MKRVYKVGVGALSLAAAGLTVWSAAANKLPVFSSVRLGGPAAAGELEVPEAGSAPAGGLGVGAAGEARPEKEPAAAGSEKSAEAPASAPADPSVPVPSDLKVTVRKTAKGPIVSFQRTGHVVALQLGKERWVGLNRLDWTPKPGQPPTLVWETTSGKTLETVRGQVTWSAEDGKVAVQNATLPAATHAESAAHHACRAHGDGAGGFTVLCRVDGAAAAATVEGDDPRKGVWSQAGTTTMVRFDIPMEGDGVDTKVLGYEKGGRGVIVRVEASRAPGETAPSLAILSDHRVQPQTIRRIGCFCMLPAREF